MFPIDGNLLCFFPRFEKSSTFGEPPVTRQCSENSSTPKKVDEIARNYFRVISSYKGERPALLIHGGEPTVNIKGTGRGGRNQQLVHEMLNLHLTENTLKGTSFYRFS